MNLGATSSSSSSLSSKLKLRNSSPIPNSPKSSSDYSPPRKCSRSSIDKNKQNFSGTLSPLHTRRGLNSGDVAVPTPDFAIFSGVRECPKLIIVAKGDCSDVKAAFAELDKLQAELEQILVHNIDHQKKIYGELTFLTTGDYPSDDIANRPMPSCELRPAEFEPSCSKDFTKEKEVEEQIIGSNFLDEDLDVWPPVNLPQKFWTFAHEFIGSVDERYLQQWWSNIVKPFCNKCVYSEHEGQSQKNSIASYPRECQINNNSISLPHKQNGEISTSRKRLLLSPKHHLVSPPRSKRQLSVGSSPLSVRIPRASELSPSRTFPSVDYLLKSYFDLEKNEKRFYSGSNYYVETRKSHIKKETTFSISSGVCQAKLKRELSEGDDTFDSDSMYGPSEDNETSSCNEALYLLNCALTEYYCKDENSKAERYGKLKVLHVEDVYLDEALRKCSSGKNIEEDNEVSRALKKLHREMVEKEGSWRSAVSRIWHRLIAEYLHSKLERELDKADQELFDVYDKYYSDYPKRRPKCEAERVDCLSVLHRRNEIAKAYYGPKYISLGKVKYLKR